MLGKSTSDCAIEYFWKCHVSKDSQKLSPHICLISKKFTKIITTHVQFLKILKNYHHTKDTSLNWIRLILKIERLSSVWTDEKFNMKIF